MAAHHEQLAELLVQWEAERRLDPDLDINAFCQRRGCPDRAADLREMIACFDSIHMVERTDPAGGPAPPLPKKVGRFPIQRELGRGGLGVVYLAVDETMEREIALKVMQPAAAADQTARRRFEREARITGKLDHPGVVPVYALERSTDGVATYTMRVIGGASMRTAIECFHAADRGEWNRELRRLLRGFAAACETVAFAHSRGIIHRDLKPHNIMLGAYGETMVIDWGLAREVHTEEPEQSLEIPPPPPTHAMQGTDATAMPTVEGQAMGTWGYMSPEQALGNWGKVGPASDIFSLGATLYHILTGRPPYLANDVPIAVQQCRFDSPRRIAAHAPRALEAICLRAMAADPASRYPDARTLADEIERWFADEPVIAYRDPVSVRLRRWSKRNRTLVATAAALLVTTVIGLTAGLFLVNREKERTRAALHQVTRAQERTRQALDETTAIAVERQMARQRRLTAADRAFLNRVLSHYRDFAAESGQTAEAREGVADAHFRIAAIYRQLGDREAAETNYRTAREQYSNLIQSARPDRRDELRYQRARGIYQMAVVQLTSGRAAEAEKLLRELADELPPVIAGLTGSAAHEARQELAHVHTGLGQYYLAADRRDDSAASFRRAAEIHADLERAEPASPEHAAEHAQALSNLGAVLLTQPNQRAEAVRVLEQARTMLEQLINQYTDEPNYSASLAKNLISLADASFLQFKLAAGLTHLQRAIAQLRPAVRDYPGDIEFRALLAHALRNIGVIRSRIPGSRDQAITDLHEATNLLERLIEEDPTGLDQRLGRAFVRLALGNLYRASEPNEAERLFDGAADDFQRVIDGGQSGRVARPMLAKLHSDRAELSAPNDPDKAITALRRAIELGFADVARLRTNAFAALHSRKDFQTLVMQLEDRPR